MTAPTENSSFKIVTTQYYPDTNTVESITRENVGLLSGRKAEDLTAAISEYQMCSKILCGFIIPSLVIGVAATITIIFVWALRTSHNSTFDSVMPPIASCSLGLGLALGVIYLSRKEKPITISQEAFSV